MNLRGSIARLQNSGTRFYVAIAQCFSENRLVRDVWLEMAHDEEQQAASLRSLPQGFWSELRHREQGVLEALQACLPVCRSSTHDDHSLQKCLAKTLEFEEPVILKVYSPLIRQLRTEWTNQALDFYIMVKAHLARLLRVIQLFAGDPLLVQRVELLLQNFEKEVQKPESPPVTGQTLALRRATQGRHAEKARKISARKAQVLKKNRPLPLAKRAKTIQPRSKSLVKNLELRRRRVRR